VSLIPTLQLGLLLSLLIHDLDLDLDLSWILKRGSDATDLGASVSALYISLSAAT